MDDLSEKLSGILNDPKSMERVRQMAESLLGDDPPPKESHEKNSLFDMFTGENMPSPEELKKIMGIMSRFKSAGDDCRTLLLKALKPNLSPERQKKVDTAVKILQFIEILPFLKESGFLSL